MAKLPSFDLSRRDDSAGVNYHETFSPKVSRDGVFSVPLPEHLKPIHYALRRAKGTGYETCGGMTVEAVSTQLETLKKELKACLDEYHKSEVIEEAVILYYFTRTAHYVVSDDGRVFPTGYAADQAGYPYGQRADWSKNMDGSHPSTNEFIKALAVGFSAKVHLKRTFKRSTADTVSYIRWEGNGPHGRALNSFCNILLTQRQPGSEFYGKQSGVMEMPYNEDAAKFFHDSMLGLCGLAERMTRFFGDDAAIQCAIAGNLPVALPFHQESSK